MIVVPYSHVYALAGLVFSLGLICILARRNLVMILIGVEVMMNAAAIAFVAGALRWQQLEGQAFVLFIIAVAAAEVALGLVLVVSLYRRSGSVDPDHFNLLKR